MAYICEGTIEIDTDELFAWVRKNYYPISGDSQFKFGVPRINKSNQTMEIDFAAGDDTGPETWAEKPDVFRQWE